MDVRALPVVCQPRQAQPLRVALWKVAILLKLQAAVRVQRLMAVLPEQADESASLAPALPGVRRAPVA